MCRSTSLQCPGTLTVVTNDRILELRDFKHKAVWLDVQVVRSLIRKRSCSRILIGYSNQYHLASSQQALRRDEWGFLSPILTGSVGFSVRGSWNRHYGGCNEVYVESCDSLLWLACKLLLEASCSTCPFWLACCRLQAFCNPSIFLGVVSRVTGIKNHLMIPDSAIQAKEFL